MCKRIYHIPINNLSREEAEKSILELMSEYHDDVEWNSEYIAKEKRKERNKKLERIFK